MLNLREPLFQHSALQNLKLYRYSAVDKSPLTKYVLRHCMCQTLLIGCGILFDDIIASSQDWDFAVTMFPMSMAPNLITLTGLGFIFANVATLIAYIPDLIGPGPSWVYYSFAAGLFMYQTFDNVDGRQARRTGSSSALGHIFDHTIDSLNTPLGGLIQVVCLGFGHSPRGVFMVMIGLWPMWLSTWEEYYTGTLYLGYINGPDEGILIACCVQLISGFFGPAVWEKPVKYLVPIHGKFSEVKMIDIFLCFVIFAVVVLHAPACLYNVYTTRNDKRHFSLRSALKQHIPFILYNLIALSWILSPHSTLLKRPHEGAGGLIDFSLLITFTFGKLGPRVILARLTNSPFPWFNSGAFVPLIGGAILANLPYFGIHIPIASASEIWYLRAAMAYALLDFVVWFTTLCRKFMATLDIACLSIPKGKAQHQN